MTVNFFPVKCIHKCDSGRDGGGGGSGVCHRGELQPFISVYVLKYR